MDVRHPVETLKRIGLEIRLPLGPCTDERAPQGLRLPELAPWARGGLLLLSGGPGFFEAFQRERHLYEGHADPLDDWTRDNVEAFVAALNASGTRAEARYPFWNEPEPLPFLQLGRLAGLKATSLFGLGLHPEFGSFIAYRALILLDREPPSEFTTQAPAPDWPPCASCAAPCIEACPASAVSRQGWAMEPCLDHRRRDESCEEGCLSRLACPIGSDRRPSPEALRFHQAASRAFLLQR